MKVITVKNQLEGAKIGFDLLKEAMDNGAKTLGLATGSTPVEFYNQIVKSDLDFSDMTSVNLDEYVGLDGSDEQSYRYFMSKHLFNEKPFKENFLPNGKAADLEAETKLTTKSSLNTQLISKSLELVKMDISVSTNLELHLKKQHTLSISKKAQLKQMHVSSKMKRMYHAKRSRWVSLQSWQLNQSY